MKFAHVMVVLLVAVSACSGEPTDRTEQTEPDAPAPVAPIVAETTAAPGALHMFALDCGRIEISDLDTFSTAGDYAGETDVFADTCWLIRHPDGDLLWDLGLPAALVGQGGLENGVYTISLDRNLQDQLVEIGLFASDVDYISISHSHFDHTGQVDPFSSATWLVHADELAAMFPADPAATVEEESEEGSNQYQAFESLSREEFTGEKDVFGDGTVIIIPTPGHTPGHTSLFVDLPETGPVMLSGDLYHREESRTLKRIPRFNTDEAQTRASMDLFEARVAETGARVIIQHEQDHIDALPKAPNPIK